MVHTLRRSSILWAFSLLAIVVAKGAAADPITRWGTHVLQQPDAWYGSPDARAAAEQVIVYQSDVGAWPKNHNLLETITPEDLRDLNSSGKANTIDNGATTLPMRFLARVHQASPNEKYIDAFTRGLEYLIDSQYDNGGFPQFYPLRGDEYYSRITYNDGAMSRAMALLQDVASAEAPYHLIDDKLRAKAGASVQLGIDCILKTQIVQNGRPTAWCAQHDEQTLEPAWARAYEPPSLSGSESVGVVRFLMSIEQPTPKVVASIEGAIAWFRSVAIKGIRQDRIRRDDGRTERVLVPDPSAPLLWARFYELETNRPLYLDRDSVFRYDYNEIGYERRSGYSYNGTWPASLLEADYPAWQQKHRSPNR